MPEEEVEAMRNDQRLMFEAEEQFLRGLCGNGEQPRAIHVVVNSILADKYSCKEETIGRKTLSGLIPRLRRLDEKLPIVAKTIDNIVRELQRGAMKKQKAKKEDSKQARRGVQRKAKQD